MQTLQRSMEEDLTWLIGHLNSQFSVNMCASITKNAGVLHLNISAGEVKFSPKKIRTRKDFIAVRCVLSKLLRTLIRIPREEGLEVIWDSEDSGLDTDVIEKEIN